MFDYDSDSVDDSFFPDDEIFSDDYKKEDEAVLVATVAKVVEPPKTPPKPKKPTQVCTSWEQRFFTQKQVLLPFELSWVEYETISPKLGF